MPQFEAFRTIIESNTDFILTTHINPDGDGLGAEVALARHLKSCKKQATILNHDATPDNYLFLERLYPIQKFDALHHQKIIRDADVIMLLDTNHPDRIATMKPPVMESKAVKVCIDHHLEPGEFADLYLLDESATSTGEIIYHLICYLADGKIEHETAIALYTAILTDTGSFRFPKTDPEIHKIVAHLIQTGADPVEIYEQVYERGSVNRMRLLGMALANLKLEYGGKLAYMTLTREMFDSTGAVEPDTDAFVPYTLGIDGVQIGLMFSELTDTIKINFRSKGDIRINELAKEFGGNGHKNAAGALIPRGRLSEITPLVLERAKAYL